MRGKAVLLADLHLHPTPLWRREWMRDFMDSVVSEFGGAGSGYHLFVLGDAFEVRDRVDSRVLNDFISLVGRWRGGDVVWISGQHDSYLPGRATLESLSHMGVAVVDRAVFRHEATDSWHVPFCRVDEDYVALLAGVPDGATVFTHLPTVEAIHQFATKDIQGISAKEFDRFGAAYSGDIHSHCEFGRLVYVGAPSQRDWRDKHVKGCYGVIEDGDFRRIYTAHPRHIEVSSAAEIPAGEKVVVRASAGVEIEAGGDVLSVAGASAIEVDSVRLSADDRGEEDVLREYVASNPPLSGPDAALAAGLALLSEASEAVE